MPSRGTAGCADTTCGVEPFLDDIVVLLVDGAAVVCEVALAAVRDPTPTSVDAFQPVAAVVYPLEATAPLLPRKGGASAVDDLRLATVADAIGMPELDG